jgi:hypothetical protein
LTIRRKLVLQQFKNLDVLQVENQFGFIVGIIGEEASKNSLRRLRSFRK